MTDTPLLEVQDLKKHFTRTKGLFNVAQGVVRAVDGVSFSVREGTCFGLVGESGCGKTTMARMILQLDKPTEGTVRFRGRDINDLHGEDIRGYKRSVQAVFQDPYSSLSPRMTVENIVGEPLLIHEHADRSSLPDRVRTLLQQVGMKPDDAKRYPHQFSGGQRQRVAIARALALNPSLIVLDEPVSSLDVATRAQIVNLLSDLQEEFGLSYLLISHDMALVEHMCDDVAVMYTGRIAEMANAKELYREALHPYTDALLGAVPIPDPTKPLDRNKIVGGEVADPANPPSGCRFHPRCRLREQLGSPESCVADEPDLRLIREGRHSACHFADTADREAAMSRL